MNPNMKTMSPLAKPEDRSDNAKTTVPSRLSGAQASPNQLKHSEAVAPPVVTQLVALLEAHISVIISETDTG